MANNSAFGSNFNTICRDGRIQPAILKRKRKSDCEVTLLSPVSESGTTAEITISDSYHEELSPVPSNTFRMPQCLNTPRENKAARNSPLPSFSWADPSEVWQLMIDKDSTYIRNPQLMKRHPMLHARMRAILLDWLMEVCEVYKLHRETFYLAQDFIDRYLATQVDVPKQQLQLLGITSLFIAAKVEEIYPPKLAEFAYVTDEACTETEIVEKELVILKILNWDLTPMTMISWLNVYLQLGSSSASLLKNCDNFIFPEYSGKLFAKVAELLDLCVLDISALQFSYGVLAASALYHITSERVALSATGFQFDDLEICVDWMTPFARAIEEQGSTEMKTFAKIPDHEIHSIQSHTVNLQLLEKALAAKVENVSSSTACHLASTPRSLRKLPRGVQLSVNCLPGSHQSVR